MTDAPRIAYLVLCHTDPAQFHRLVEALTGNADFFVHVDAKVNLEEFKPSTNRDDVFLLERRINVYWAGFSIVEATLLLLAEALRRRKYDRLVLLNGLDYPIKPTKSIEDYLLGHPNLEFIRFFDIAQAASPVYVDLAVRYHFIDAPRWLVNRYYDFRAILQKALRPIRRRLPFGYVHCFGHMQWAITGDCAAYLLQQSTPTSPLFRFYQYSFAPDERYFHTLVANSPFRQNAGGIEPYRGFGTYLMANLHHIHPTLNKTYVEDDFDELSASDKYFVKKVKSSESGSLIKLIDARLRRAPSRP